MAPHPQTPVSELRAPPVRRAKVLGYSGLIPFAGLAMATWVVEESLRMHVVFALLAYGATILSFLGAIHWGLALRDPIDPPIALLTWGVMPSLVAWAALLSGGSVGLYLLAAGLWTCWAVDRSVYPRFGLQGWLAMRVNLTTVASLSCVGAALHSSQ